MYGSFGRSLSVVLTGVMAALCLAFAAAQDVLGGDIRFTHISGYTWSFEVVICTDPDGPAATPELFVGVGGDFDTVPRLDDLMIIGDCGTLMGKSRYAWTTVFPGPGVYQVFAQKPGRSNNVENMPALADWLCLRAEMILLPEASDNAPVFTAPQTALLATGNALVHDPQVTDPDGDSLSFELVTPAGEDCAPIADYQLPQEVTPPGDALTIDPITGVLTWTAPSTLGLFNVVVRCTEWRAGLPIGSVVRDMTLNVCQLPTTIGELLPVEEAMHIRWTDDGWWVQPLAGQVGQLTVHDALGRILARQRVSAAGALVALPGDAQGLCVFRLSDPQGRPFGARTVVLPLR